MAQSICGVACIGRAGSWLLCLRTWHGLRQHGFGWTKICRYGCKDNAQNGSDRLRSGPLLDGSTVCGSLFSESIETGITKCTAMVCVVYICLSGITMSGIRWWLHPHWYQVVSISNSVTNFGVVRRPMKRLFSYCVLIFFAQLLCAE